MTDIERVKMLQGCLNTSEYARKLGVAQKTLDAYLRGERKLSVDLLKHICTSHKVSADYILGLDSPVQNQPNFRTEQPKEESTSELVVENRLLREEIARLHNTIIALSSGAAEPKKTRWCNYAINQSRQRYNNHNTTWILSSIHIR